MQDKSFSFSPLYYQIDIFACRLILVPIHSRHHWCLVAVDNKDKSIIFYDSMRSGGMRYLMKIKAYMNEEAAARQITPIEWALQSKEGIPKQRNTSDCGVFVCQVSYDLLCIVKLLSKRKDVLSICSVALMVSQCLKAPQHNLIVITCIGL